MNARTRAKALLCLLFLLSLTRIASAQNVPHSSHVWVIAEENHSFEDIVGNSQMPYYNQLIRQYGLAAQFYSDQHSSLPALMWFVAGAAIEPDNDTVSCDHTSDNVVRELLKHEYSWKSYEENLPYAGFQGLYGGNEDTYYRRHNPLIDFSDVCPGTGQDTNSVPYTQMAEDFAKGDTVNYAFVTPDVLDDAHSASLQDADRWLQAHVPAILARPEFKQGGDGILFVVWDEGDIPDDNRCSATVSQGCGGRTATLVIGPNVKPGYQSTITYHNESVLATVCAAMGLSTCPGAAQTAAPMADFFIAGTGSTSTPNGISISTPGNGATLTGAVHLVASATESEPISQTQVWDNGSKLGVYGTKIDVTYDLGPGEHTTTVVDLNSSYQQIHQSSVTYNVPALVNGVQIASPATNQVISSTLPVHVVAEANESIPINQLQVWDNGVKLGAFPGASVNQYFNLAPGLHTVTVEDLNDSYEVIHQSAVTYAVQASGVMIVSPTVNQTLSTTTVQIVAHASESVAVNQMQVWDNGVKLGWFPGSNVSQSYRLAPGKHTVTVEDLDNSYRVISSSSITYSVQ